MAWVEGLLILFAALASTSGSVHYINIHICQLSEGRLMCPWRGQGVYTPDRPLPSVHTLDMVRMLNGAVLDVRVHTPDLQTIIVNGDITCEDVKTNTWVAIYLNQRQCDKQYGTTNKASETRTTVSSTDYQPDTSDSTLTSIEAKKTTLSGYPNVSITWENITEVKVILCIVVILLVVVSISLYCVGYRHLQKTKRNNRTNRIELEDIPTFQFDDFVNTAHAKRS